MRIPGRSSILVVLVMSLGVSPASGQEAVPLPASTGELRVEFSGWGLGSIYDGDTRIGSIGIVQSDLEKAVNGSAEAVRHARRFRQERMTGQTLIAAGTLVSSALLAGYASGNRLEMRNGQAVGMLAGVAAISVGSHRLVLSHRALARSIEEHNGIHRTLVASGTADSP
jgi:hypothetical protein